MGTSNALSNHREQIAELHQRLIEYIQKTTQNFSILQDRFDEIQVTVDKISTQTSKTNDQYSSRFKKIETQMTQISDEIDKLYTIINVNKERSLKTFEKYLCELCSNAIGQRGKNNEYKFVICNMNMKKFPCDKKCPEFKLEEGIEE
jgi:septation ring formation regulator EzrA